MMWLENFKTTHAMSRDVFMSVPSLEPVEPVLWKKITIQKRTRKTKV